MKTTGLAVVKNKNRSLAIAVLIVLTLSSMALIPRVFAQTSYNVSFSQTGSSVQATVQYSLSNGTIGSKTTPFSISVQSGLALSYSFGQDVKGTTNGVRYAFVSVNPSSPQTISGALTVQATYRTQYLVSFNQTGSAVAPSVTYSLSNGTTDGGVTPFTIWVDASQSVSYDYQSNPCVSVGSVCVATDVSYTLAHSSSDGSLTITSPVNVSMSYEKLVGVGSDPFSSVYDPANNQVFVTNYQSNSVSVIDGATGSPTENTVINTIPVGTNPTWIAYDSTDNEVFVVNQGSNSTSVIAASSDTVVATIPSETSGTITGIAYDPDTDQLYVSSDCGYPLGPNCEYIGGVDIINAALNEYVASVNASCGGGNPSVDTIDNTIFVPDSCPYDLPASYYDYSGIVTVISGSTTTQPPQWFMQDLDEPCGASGCNDDPINSLYDSSNDYVYISDPGVIGDTVNSAVTALEASTCSFTALDCSTNDVYAVTNIQAGNGSDALALDPNNGDLYVTNDYANTTSAISTATNSVVATIKTGIGGSCGSNYCASILFDPSNYEIYVPNPHSNYTSVINGNVSSPNDNKALKNIPVLSEPFLGQGAYDSADNDVYVLNPGQQYLGEVSNPATVIYTGLPNSVSFSPNSGGVEDGFSVSSEATVSGPSDNSYLSPNLASGCTNCNGAPNSYYFGLDWTSNPVLISQSGVEDSVTIDTGASAPPGTYNFVVSAVSPSGATGSGIYGLTVTGYTVTFNETGLPLGTKWSVSLQIINNGVITGYTMSSSMTNQVVFENQAGGTVGWNVSSSISGASPGVRYVPALASGTISIFSNTNLALGAYTTQYEVTLDVTPTSSGSTSPPQGVNWLDAASPVQIAATNSSGYAFSSWSANTSSITLNDANAKSTSAEVSGPDTITATFIPTVKIELNSTAAAVRQGNNVSSSFLVLGGPQSVTLSNSSLPAGASLSWQEKSITDSTTGTLDSFVIQTSIATPTGTHIVKLTATGADGQKDEVNYTLVVLSPTATTAALPASTGNGDVTFSTSAGAFLNISSISTPSLGQKDKPSTVSFPYGMFSWTVDGLAKGQTISMSITLPTALKPDTQYWKYNGTQWINATSLITAEEGNTTTLTITDGGPGDLDGVANGEITDPGGVGFAANIVTSTIPATIPGAQPNGVIYDSDNGLLYLTEIRAPYDDLNVSVINPETNSIVASIPVPGVFSSGAIAFDPSNGFLYVPESDGTVTVIDGATNSVVNTITIPTGNNLDDGLGIVYDSGNGILYVTGTSSSVYAIDPSTGLILGQILLPNGGGLGQLAYDPSNGLLYQTVTLSATQSAVDVINPSSGGVVSIISLNHSAGTIVYDSTSGAIYVTDQSNVSEIDPSSNLISSSIVVPAYGGNLQSGFASFDPNTNTLYVSDDSYNVFAIDPTTNSIIAQVSFPEATTVVSGIAVDTNNCNLYAAIGTGSPFSGYLAVIPTGCASGVPLPPSAPASSNSASSTISVGSGPIAEALDTSNNELFVGNAGSDSITILNAGTGSVITTISLVFPSYYTEVTPTSLTFDPSNGYIYVTSFSAPPYEAPPDGSYAVIN
ncbi:MAG: beta strand repeat-containing protein, partial [Nitrososphaerales archaeon]